MTKDAIELRLTLVADMLQRAVNEITGVLSDIDDGTTSPEEDKDEKEDGPGHGNQAS